MRIEYLSKSTIPSRAANSVHVMKMCQALASLGHDVTLHASQGVEFCDNPFEYYGVNSNFNLAIEDEKQFLSTRWLARAQSGIPLFRVGSLRQVLHGRALAAQAFQPPPDLIYARHLLWLLGAAGTSIPFVFESHKPPEKWAELQAHRILFRAPNFRGLVVISAKLKDLYLSQFPQLPSNRVVVAHDGADSPDLDRTPRLPRLPGRPQVGYVGHLYPGRGVDLILETARQTPEADFHLVGGTQKDIEALKASALPANLNIHGFVSPGEIGDFYTSFDFFLAPYQKKVAVHGGQGDTSAFMSPLKIFEYMSWGKCLLASDLPVLREVLENGRTAVMLKPENSEHWSAALKKLITNPEQAKNLGTAAQHEFESKYTWSTRAQQVLQAVT